MTPVLRLLKPTGHGFLRFFQEMVMDAPYPFSQPGLIPRAGRVLQGWWKKTG